MGSSAPRLMIATQRENIKETTLLRDELPPLEQDEIRLCVDKVGLSANNLFYAQMGEAPFLKFFAVYPLGEEHKHLAILPTWGIGTVIESQNPDFQIGEQYRGFLHMTNVVQMKARRTEDGFIAFGGKRDKINQAYNGFKKLEDSDKSPFSGPRENSDLAMTSAPGASSGFILYELLKTHNFYGGDSVILTSASSKLSLAIALLLQSERNAGTIERVIGYTSRTNAEFVKSTGLYDNVLTYESDLPSDVSLNAVYIDVAGDAAIYKRLKSRLAKGLAVGGTHADTEASTFTAFGASGFLKMFIDMIAPQTVKNWANRKLNPPLEMFFAPTVIKELLARWGQPELDEKTNAALKHFSDTAIDSGWITVNRCESIDAAQTAYHRIVQGEVPPSEAVIISLAAGKS